MGSELSAASGRGSEVSEWPRSKFPASAVRQRRNFGHRNRIIGPYGVGCRGWVTLLVRAVCGASGGNHRDGCGFFLVFIDKFAEFPVAFWGVFV